jgi:5,10-methylenetetrahydromethanopterin reductase
MFQPPLPALLEIAAATSKVRLGPACLNPFSLHPVEIAGQIAALDLASDGRAFLGLARGTWLDAVGIEQRQPVGALGEAAELVAALLRHDPEGYAGSRFRLDAGTTLRYETRRPAVPLLIGAWGRRTGELAGRSADEVKIGGSANPAMVGVMREYVVVGARSKARDPDDVGIVLGAVSVVDEDGERARYRARSEVAMYLAVVSELDPTVDVPAEVREPIRRLVARGDHEAAGQLITDNVLDRFAFSGTPEHVASLVNAVLAAGAKRVDLGTPHGLTDESGIDLIGRRVLPLVQRNDG